MTADADALRIARGIRAAGREGHAIALDGFEIAARAAQRAAEGDSPVATGALRRSWRVVRRGRVVSLVNTRDRAEHLLGGAVAAEAIDLVAQAVGREIPTIQRALLAKASER